MGHPSLRLATLFPKFESYSPKGPENVKNNITISLYVETFRAATRHNDMKRDSLDIQYPNFENSRLGLIESASLMPCYIPHAA